MAPSKSSKTVKTKKKTMTYPEEALKKALEDIREKKKGIRETCRLYNIPRTTVQDRLNGKRGDVLESKGPNPVLGVEGENKVKEWLFTIAKCGFPVKKQELLDTVQKIMKDHGTKNPFKDDRPGDTWYLNFLKRHPDLSYRAAEGINKARANVTEESIRIWFRQLDTYLRETNNQDILDCPKRIFNGDESEFSMCPKTGKVLAPKGYKNLFQVKSANEKENLTVLVTFNANGQVCPPLVVFPYVKPRPALVNSMPEDWCLGKSESGWMRSDVFFEYITNDFNNWVERNCIRKPILLLVDGHKSHMSLVLSAMCEKLGIILYALPPNTTHMLQPADVSVFAPLKSSWKTVVRKFLSKPENINSCVTKTNFCKLFQDTLEDTNMNTNIKNGFRKCGLYPFNPDAVDYTKCVQNHLENVQKGPAMSKEITREDIVSTRKVLKHLRPILKEKKIRVGVILKELRKLKPPPSKHGTDSEDITTDSSVNQSTSFQMEHSSHGVSITDPSLPILDNISDVLPTNNTSGNESSSSSLHNITINVTADIHSVPHRGAHEVTHFETESVDFAHEPAIDSSTPCSAVKSAVTTCDNFDEIIPYVAENIAERLPVIAPKIESRQLIARSVISQDTFDDISSYNTEEITINTNQNSTAEEILPLPKTKDIVDTYDATLNKSHEKIEDTAITHIEEVTTDTNIHPTTDDSLSTLHLTGTGVDSYLEIGSVVSLDNVVIIPTENITVTENDAFSKHLFIPEAPQRAKPKQVKTPAAVSPAAWRKYYEDKENLKAEKQAAILKRKQERLEVTKQKKAKKESKSKSRNQPKPKPPGKQAKQSRPQTRGAGRKSNETLKEMCTECCDILISDTEEDEDKNIGCDFCHRWYHLKCTVFVGSAYIDVIGKSYKCNICIADQYIDLFVIEMETKDFSQRLRLRQR